MHLIKEKYILLNSDAKNKTELFAWIAKKAETNKLVTNTAQLVASFEDREKEITTALEDSFAIPHARFDGIKEAAVFFIRLNKAITWDDDNNKVKYIIAMIVPEEQGDYLDILSGIAVKLMNTEIRQQLMTLSDKTQICEILNTESKQTQSVVVNSQSAINVLAITSCVVGIAHTYMAEEALLKTGGDLGYNIRVETHGSKGIGTPFTQKEIDTADIVIFATDTKVDNTRFVGKKFYQTSVAKAIKNPTEIFKQALKSENLVSQTLGEFSAKKGAVKSNKQGVLSHILAGISYMIPVIVLGGICLAFSLGLAKAIWGPEAGPDGPNGDYKWGPLNILNIIGGAAFTLMIPILAGFIANSIAGRAAIAPAMVGAFIGNDAGNLMPLGKMTEIKTPMGFIGALISGLLVGYFVLWVNKWKVPKSLAPAMPIFFIPLMAGIGISVIFIYIIGGPIGWVMGQVSTGIENAYSGKIGVGLGLGLGLLLGAMASFDMGGPINKIAFVTCTLLIEQGIQQPMGAMAAAIPVAPLGMGLSTIIFKRFFNKDEQGLGIAALIMGCIGISEGAIPFALRDPRRAIISNVVGGAIAGAFAGAFKITDAAGHGGPIVAVLGAVPYGIMTLYYFLAVAIGVTATTTIYGFWMIFESGKKYSVREAHTEHLNSLRINKTDALSEINEEIKTNKANKNLDKMQELKIEKAQVKKQFQTDIMLAKTVLKNVEKLEKENITTNKKNIRQDKLKIKTQETNKKDKHSQLTKVEKTYREPFIAMYQTQIK